MHAKLGKLEKDTEQIKDDIEKESAAREDTVFLTKILIGGIYISI